MMIGPVAQILESWNYLVVIALMMGGLFIVISQNNLVKKLVGLAIFQTSVFIFYISVGKVAGGTAPILMDAADTLYSNPLPHVLILTAIVVGVATTALGLALILRIHAAFGSIEDDEVLALKAEAAEPRARRGGDDMGDAV
jgi:multicomponent Na+:H+ antiporter subunit C